MIESFVFQWLITYFEERALRVDDAEGRHRARTYLDDVWCSSSGTL